MAAMQQVLLMGSGSVYLPSSLIIAARGTSAGDEAASSAVRLTLRTNGSLSIDYSANGNATEDPTFPQEDLYAWLVGGSSSLYSAKMRILTGAFGDGAGNFGLAAVNTWIPINSEQIWYVQANSNDSVPSSNRAVTAVLEIAFGSNPLAILASCNIDFRASALTQSGPQQ